MEGSSVVLIKCRVSELKPVSGSLCPAVASLNKAPNPFELLVITTLMFDLPVNREKQSLLLWMEGCQHIITVIYCSIVHPLNQKETAGPGYGSPPHQKSSG